MRSSAAVFLLLAAAVPVSLKAGPVVIDFEAFFDSTPVRLFYAGLGVTFVKATGITAGVSLNEFEFPPTSGVNVAFDDTGPITINFSPKPATSVAGFFTYTVPLTLLAFDSLNHQVASAQSAFSANFVSSGNPPNESIQLTFAGGISRVTIAGDPSGSSFTLDDLTFTPITAVPEPGTFPFLIGAGIATIIRHSFVRKG